MKKKAPYEIFKSNNGVARSKLLAKEGLSSYKLNKLISEGKVEKISRGLYQWTASEVDEKQLVQVQIPEGVMCLDSAAFHHNLTVFIPPRYRIAIPRKKKVVLPEYPLISLMYWDQKRYVTGIEILTELNNPVKIYDQEKTICDLIHYQKKMGLDLVKEVIKNYLQSPNRNLEKLGQYAKALNQAKKVDQLIMLLT